MSFRFLALCLLGMAMVGPVQAQPTIQSIVPQAISPGTTTRLTIAGQNLKAPLRIGVSCRATIQVVSVEPSQSVIDVTLAADIPVGPIGMWLATDDGIVDSWSLLVDDLPSVVDLGANHSIKEAQEISINSAVDGIADGAKSDFYRFQLNAAQPLSIEVVAQRMGSTMDPILRMIDPQGREVLLRDDEASDADCRASVRDLPAGQYVLEIRDNRFATGGRYRLRLGDFPVVDLPFPMAVSTGSDVAIQCVSRIDERWDQAIHFADAPTGVDRILAIKRPQGMASTWTKIAVRDFPVHVESISSSSQPLSIPIGISGKFDATKEKDLFTIQGVAGLTARFQSRTRSLGAATLLQMRLLNTTDTVVAQTTVSDLDEWSFDYTFPDAGLYRLEVQDLLGRSGAGFGYYIDIEPSGRFSVALKSDVGTREKYLVESPLDPTTTGAMGLDLQVQRFGYDGPIEIALESEVPGLQLLQPIIPGKVNEMRVYLNTSSDWSPQALHELRLIAKATEGIPFSTRVSTLGVRRLKNPLNPFPAPWMDGHVVIAGVSPIESFFDLERASVRLPRAIHEHTIPIPLKRLQAEFKEAVAIWGEPNSHSWAVTAALDKDVCTCTITRPASDSATASELALVGFGEWKGRGKLERIQLPIEWFDPLQIVWETDDPWIVGQSASLRVRLLRQGDDPQPVQLKLAQLPAGVVVPESIEIAKDMSEARIAIQLTENFDPSTPLRMQWSAHSKFGAKEFQVPCPPLEMQVSAGPTSVAVFPDKIQLQGKRDRQQVIVSGIDMSGDVRDWTRLARFSIRDANVARYEKGVVFPVANGVTELTIEAGKNRWTLPISVKAMEVERPIQFENEVLVALSKQGCNSGACHGSPSGKGSFRLSLRAFDPKLDELTLIREDLGRRLNLIDAEQSLLLQKPLMKVPHGGGMQVHRSDAAYSLIRDWISQGAQANLSDDARCIRLEVHPIGKQVRTRHVGQQQLAVTAHYSDGSSRDVTHLVAYESSNTSVASVDAHGFVQCTDRGEAVILVRYLEHIESLPMMFIEEVPGFQWQEYPQVNYVDQLVDSKLKQMQYLPSPLSSDAEFLRRVYLDVIGILPTVEEVEAFLGDSSPDKRRQAIQDLLRRPEHAKFWTLKWGDLLKMTSKNLGEDGVYKYHRWVEQAIRDNMPYDEFARHLLTGSGSTLVNPPANFYRTSTDMNECVETISQVFLGARLQCAKCHNHPFERWTQDNYYGMGAFFQRVQRRKTQRPGEMFIWAATSGEVTQPRTGQVMKPWLPQVGSMDIEGQEDRRNAFAQWLVQPENPYFARIEANRIWSQLFARGIVDPIDDFRDSNPPTNAALLDALAKDFVESGFDRRHLLETILNSRTYQASFQSNAYNSKDRLYFSHQEPRLLGAEQLLDAVNQLTGTDQVLGGLPAETKATQLPAPDVVKVDFLKVFGQPERSTVCACERSEETNLGMAIELFNGPLIYEKLKSPNNRFRKSIADGKSVDVVVRELYMSGLSRLPSEHELTTAVEHCKSRGDVIAGLEDVCWALLNTDEFLFQH